MFAIQESPLHLEVFFFAEWFINCLSFLLNFYLNLRGKVQNTSVNLSWFVKDF